MFTTRIPHALAIALLAGCSGGRPDAAIGQFGEDEDLVCVEESREPVAFDDTVQLEDRAGEPIDVAVEAVLAHAEATYSAELTWEATGEKTTLTVVLDADADQVELVHFGPADEEIPPENCGSALSYPVSAEVVSDDGRLAETFDADAWGDPDGMHVDSFVSPLSGTLDPVAMHVGSEAVQPDEIRVNLHVNAGSSPFSGSIGPVRIDDPDEDVQALGTWPGELEGGAR